MDGQTNTDILMNKITNDGYVSAGSSAVRRYAPDICTTGSGCEIGKWYLPALGEFSNIYKNMNAINEALSELDGRIFNSVQVSSYGHSLYGCYFQFNNGATHCPYQDNNVHNNAFVRPALIVHDNTNIVIR